MNSGINSRDKVLKRMIQDGLLIQQNQECALTDKGNKEAHTVLRAHRLWKSYLESIGTPKKEVHSITHRLEHLYQAHKNTSYGSIIFLSLLFRRKYGYPPKPGQS